MVVVVVVVVNVVVVVVALLLLSIVVVVVVVETLPFGRRPRVAATCGMHVWPDETQRWHGSLLSPEPVAAEREQRSFSERQYVHADGVAWANP